MKAQLDALGRAVRMMAGRVILRLISDAELMTAQVDALADETHDGVEVMQHYGFASRPKSGAEGIMISVGGMRDNGVIIATVDREFRFKLNKDGEAALYDDLGQVVYLSRDGLKLISPIKVDISAPEVTVTANQAMLDCDDVEVSGNLHVGGDFTVEGDCALGEGAALFVKLSDNSPATKVKAK